MGTAIIVIILLCVCFIALRSTMKRIAHGCCGGGGDSVKKVRAKDTDPSHYAYHYEMEINGMTCSDCKVRVENAFHEEEGYYAVANVKKNQAVIHCKNEADPHTLRSIVYSAGYAPGEVNGRQI